MRVDFEEMDGSARVWVYQANRRLDKNEKEKITELTDDFLQKWTAHGNDLKSAANIFYDQFLVLCVDENFNQASGCSIDSSVHFIEQLGKHFNIDFLDRTHVYYMETKDTDTINGVPFTKVKERVNDGSLQPGTLTFNNMVTTKADFDQSWIVPASDTWLKKYFV